MKTFCHLIILSFFSFVTAQNLTHKTLKSGKLSTFFYDETHAAEGARIAEISHKINLKFFVLHKVDTLKMPFIQVELWHDFPQIFEPFHSVFFDTITDPSSKLAKGIKVVVRDKYISPITVLKLVKLGLEQFQNGQEEEKLGEEMVQSALNSEIEGVVKELMNIPFFRTTKSWLPEIRYAYFDDKFYFLKPETDISVFGHDDVEHFWSNSFLQTNSLTEILGNHKTGALVFSNDTSFFYVPNEKEELLVGKEPVFMPSIPHRKPIRRAVFEKNNLNKVLIYVEDENNVEIKSLFLPKSQELVMNYDFMEQEWLSKRNEEGVIKPKNNDEIVNIIIAMVVFLALTIVGVITFQHYFSEQ